MESVIDPIRKLLADRKQVEKELKKIEQQYQKAIDKARAELRGTILRLCSQAGTTLEDVFGGKFPAGDDKPKRAEKKAAAKPKATKKGAARKKGPGKYLLKGKEYDGRQARAVAGFDAVRVDGKIDDAKAIAAKMINPVWLASGGQVVKRFVDEHKLDVAAYSAK